MIGDLLQPTHLLFILAVALLVLGPKRLPEVGRALGRGLRDFRNALNTDELHEQMTSSTSSTQTPTTQASTEPTETPLQDEADTESMPSTAEQETIETPTAGASNRSA